MSHQYKYTKDEAREKMQNILKEIDSQYSNISSYVWASCLGDCTNWIVNIEFSENIWWWDFTVKAHATVFVWYSVNVQLVIVWSWQM